MADPGKGPVGYSPSPLFLDQTEARRAEKNFLGDRHTPPPLSKGLDDRSPPPTYQRLDPALLHLQTILRIVTTLQLNNRV